MQKTKKLARGASTAAHGRHRAESEFGQRTGKAATAAIAAGAFLATGAQVTSTATADAAPLEIPGAPPEVQQFASQIELPEVPALPDLGTLGQQLQSQITGNALTVKPVNGVVTSGFGSRWGTMHSGLDFAGSIGTPIHSVANGTVIEAGPASGFGLWVRVKQDDGTTAVYGHVNEMLVHAGQRVNAGDVIATVGNRGNSTGPHLHLEIWEPSGKKVDPSAYLIRHGVSLSNPNS